jgi:hypothetical protein
MATPEEGALEFTSDGSSTKHLYFTIGTTRYQLDQFWSAGTAVPVFNSGIDLGTSGRINGQVTTAAAPSITIQPGVASGAKGWLLSVNTYDGVNRFYVGNSGLTKMCYNATNYCSVSVTSAGAVSISAAGTSPTLTFSAGATGPITFSTPTTFSGAVTMASTCSFASNVSPDVDGGANLGTGTKQWAALYLKADASAIFGAEVYLRHIVGSGVQVNDGYGIGFRVYASSSINSATSGHLDLNATVSIDANADLDILTAKNIKFGTSGAGTMIGTAAAELFAFHGKTPIVQPASASQALVGAASATQTTPWGYATAAQADGIVTLINEIRNVLVNLGLMKGEA